MYSKSFENALKHTLDLEGGESNHPLDRGGHTKYGITKAVLKKYNPNLEIPNLTVELAKKIYYAFYWTPLKLDSFEPFIAKEVFDSAVNCGMRTAGKWIQKSLNLLNRNEQLYPDLKVDGVIGNNTLKAYKKLHGHDLVGMLKALNGFQFMHYYHITIVRPSQEIFIRSWLRRI